MGNDTKKASGRIDGFELSDRIARELLKKYEDQYRNEHRKTHLGDYDFDQNWGRAEFGNFLSERQIAGECTRRCEMLKRELPKLKTISPTSYIDLGESYIKGHDKFKEQIEKIVYPCKGIDRQSAFWLRFGDVSIYVPKGMFDK
jgi:hypothetical protein